MNKRFIGSLLTIGLALGSQLGALTAHSSIPNYRGAFQISSSASFRPPMPDPNSPNPPTQLSRVLNHVRVTAPASTATRPPMPDPNSPNPPAKLLSDNTFKTSTSAVTRPPMPDPNSPNPPAV